MPCRVFECAINLKKEYCTKDCEEWPCRVHYKEDFPYSKKALDAAEELLGR